MMSSAQLERVQAHTSKANRLPYFKPTRDPQQGFRVKVRGKPLNIQLPLIDSSANVCMISSNLVAQHQLKWTEGHAPVTSSVGQTSALGTLAEPIDLHLCKGTAHNMHLTAGGPDGMQTMVTEHNSAFDLLLGCSFFNRTAADMLLFHGEYAYKPHVVPEGDAQTVATVPTQMGLNKLVPSTTCTRQWPGSELGVGEVLSVNHLVSSTTEDRLYACCNANFDKPPGEEEAWQWADVASQLRGRHAWLAITGTTPAQKTTLGIGEALHAFLQEHDDAKVKRVLGSPPRTLDEQLEVHLHEKLPCTMEELHGYQEALTELRPLILCWPQKAAQADKWVALCLNLLHALSYLRAKGMHIAPYDLWMHALMDNPPALRQMFESPDVLRDPGICYDRIADVQSPIPFSDHWHNGPLSPDRQVPLEKQLHLVRHHHALTRLLRTEKACFAQMRTLSRLLWESCTMRMEQVDRLHGMPIWSQGDYLYDLLALHAEYLEGKFPVHTMDDEIPIQLFQASDKAEVQREITGMFVVVKQEGTLDRPALQQFMRAALIAAHHLATQEEEPCSPQAATQLQL